MPFLQKLKPAILALTVLSWLALLISTLLHTDAAMATRFGVLPDWVTLAAQATFAVGVFMYQRERPHPLRGTDFVGLLRRLLLGPGLLAAAGLGLHLLERLLQPATAASNPAFFAVAYTINVGLFVVFVAYTTYTWRSLVFFRASPTIRSNWLWFELLLGGTLLLRLLNWPLPAPLAYGMVGALAVFGIYLSSNQKWVAYLNRRQKWEAGFLQLSLLLCLTVGATYFLRIAQDPLLVAPKPQAAFLLLMAGLAAFYALMALLVTLFNLPTAGIFEQKREEILSLQRLSQLIQKGQDEQEVYDMLFDAAVETVEADAAWLDVDGEGREPVLSKSLNLRTEDISAIRSLLADYNLGHIEYLNNDLPNSSGFRDLDLRLGSLIVMPLRSAKRQYGSLYMLKEQTQGFDRENLGILQTFTTQTVLSIENLHLMASSLQNERVQEELKIASSVQDSLIPKNLPIDDWFEIGSHAAAAKEVGGDFYDFLHLPGKRLAILIGDVSGKGITAAFHMAQMKGIFHALMQENPLAKDDREKFPVPSKFMSMANRALTHCLEKSSFITAALYIIDYEHGGFVFARAGHCHTLYYHSIKEEVSYFHTAGLGLGIIRNDSYEKHIKNQFYDYNPGDVMVIYTDGIVEARGADQEEYGEDRLKQMLERNYYLEANEIKQQILHDLNEFSAGQPMHDDQTLLVIKFKTAQPEILS
ncbi:Serine phosphatase RsbU, regulator of sigma subunit [Hymenobacter daecheongensis DSM 21074]|uniref:Serine phosphatase RsbU, regulator of sigma subunit n=1 Tax=Hymenobacter daecheongensis DSM 21074 TaxID=1121955 RepID=A0A1M6D1T1_9BACT|nr:SpoIIE family protein phosphatase [Hymenobacter daecheongensis]SHI67071.1 Serine phosphatase RsbU, regulator of sigma subunit [Hymenobacter daecheongensis DSM 21074]